MLEIPWPITLPAATLPAVAAIWEIIPGWPLEAAVALGWGTGAGGAWDATGGAAVVDAVRVWDLGAGAARERD